MAEHSGFTRVLNKIKAKMKAMEVEEAAVRWLYESGNVKEAYSRALKLEEASEQAVLLTRVLPAYSGVTRASYETDELITKHIPVEIGFTAEGWFALRIPALLPKKEEGSCDYIRSFLYPAMRDFFKGKEPVRYTDCVLVYRHVYAADRPERRKRDHDNIEVNVVSDIIALYVMPDDGPEVCSHFYCSAAGDDDRTEVYVLPKAELADWLLLEKSMPDKGVTLYASKEIAEKKEM